MANTETSDPSIVAPVAILPIQTVAWEATSPEKCEREVIESLEAAVDHPHEVTQFPHAEDSQQPSCDLSQTLSSDEAKIDSLSTSPPAVIQRAVDSPFPPSDTGITEKPQDSATGPNIECSSSIPSTVSNSPVQQYAITTHPLHAPQIKRFTSVNITKRFLEKTSSMSGPSLGTGSLSNTSSSLSSSSQHRGISPNSRSPSFDRPVSSRLVTAKLTAVPQPSSASTSGWLRPGQTTNSNTTPTPPSTSPQPPLHESTASSFQAIKRRSGTSPAPNGVPVSTGAHNKPAWVKSTAASSNSAGRSLPGLDNKSDFPTAAEAVHSMQSLRKGKSGKGQTEVDPAVAAQKAAQQNAINETAAAFRGAHLDANTRWDEMSDEDSEDFDGVIEFGDGTQYKIEQKPNSSQGMPQERSITPVEPDGPPVAKEERFGEDMGRNWPRQHDNAVGQPPIDKPSLRLSLSSHAMSEALTQTHSPHDGVSPTSRVLFNERLNRLEPLSESKAPFGSRQREPAFTSPTYPSNIQLLQKNLPGTDFKSRGPSRANGPSMERTSWGDGPPPRGPPSVKNDERSWESRRRESMSSATGSSIRDRSRGRDKWVPPYHTTGDRDNLPGAFASPTSTRERDADRTNHLRPPLFTPMSPKGLERDNFQSSFSAVSPTISSQSFHSPVLEKSSLAASQLPDNSENVDKNVLLKSAMHLANERARKRKQELDEEEKRRGEAAERARKKAEALARAMEGTQKPESQTSAEPPKRLKTDEQVEAVTASTMSQQTSQEHLSKRLSTDHSSAPPLLLSRKPTASSLATQAESWRSKAPPVPPKSVEIEMHSTEEKVEAKLDPQTEPTLPPSDRSLVPSFPSTSPNDLLLKPDEEVEVVDFEDLGKFLGNASQEPSRKVPSRLSSRPVASDYFGEDSVEYEAKPEVLSWRRSAVKPQLTPSVDGLRTQTIPIFSTVSSPEAELPTMMDPKISQSPLLSPSKRLSQGDYVSSNPQISPVLSALRSPRASHFKEASMSALTDTMSRIKGALDGMQSHDILISKDRGKQGAPEVWRTLYDGAAQRRPLTPEKLEDFVSCIPPPSSPKPVWKTHTVKIPRVCQIREPLPKKQAHFWNQPYPPVRWDILSWDPPVEGMNKRDLSRDEIFHKKNNLPKGGKLRVVLPPLGSQQTKISQTSSKDISVDPTTFVTTTGIKIKLPSGPSSFRPAISIERARDVSSWNGSAIPSPSASLKIEQYHVIAVISNEELSTTSRSPPPDPSTLLPQAIPTKREMPTSSDGPLSANVSLPPTDKKALREPVSFLRTKDVVIREQSTSTVPNFTVNSELEPFTSEPSDQAVKAPITNDSPEPSKTESKSLPSQAFTSTAHELPRLIASKSGSKSSEESATRPGTPPSSTQHATSPWGKALAFPVLKDSPTRRGPDPEHLKAVWSQPTSIPTGSTSNSLQDITDEQLPSIPSTMQDMKSEGGETPPPIAPAPPTRLSQQEVARAFQQVPESPASRAPTYPQNSLFPQYHRPNHPMQLSHPARPSYPPSYHPHAVMSHSPSPTLMYATSVDSPVLHQRLPVNGPSPSVANGVWLPTPPPVTSQHGSYLRPGAPPPPTQMGYPPSGTTPNQMVPHRMAIMGHGSIPSAPTAMQAGGLYTPAPMHDMRNMQNMHVRSPHMAHTTPAHPHAVPMQTMHPAMFSPPPPPGHAAQPQTIYTLPNGANRGAMLPRGYEGYHAMPPHAGYPTTPYMFPS